MSDIKKIKDEIINKLKEDLDLNSVNQIKTDLFGKNGKISNEFKKLGSVAAEERKKFASDLNSIKDELQIAISKKIEDIEIKEINPQKNKITANVITFLNIIKDHSCLFICMVRTANQRS